MQQTNHHHISFIHPWQGISRVSFFLIYFLRAFKTATWLKERHHPSLTFSQLRDKRSLTTWHKVNTLPQWLDLHFETSGLSFQNVERQCQDRPDFLTSVSIPKLHQTWANSFQQLLWSDWVPLVKKTEKISWVQAYWSRKEAMQARKLHMPLLHQMLLFQELIRNKARPPPSKRASCLLL